MAHFSVLFLIIACIFAENIYNESEAIVHMQFARVAFCDQSAVESWTCGDMCAAIEPPPLHVRFLPRGSWWAVQGYVAKFQKDHCVVAFRGSVHAKNYAADMLAIPRPWPWNSTSWCENCKAHGGFAHVYNELRSAMLAAIHDFSCKTVAVVGHSLGGSLATLAALDLRGSLALNVYPVYTFGSPRVGNSALVKASGNVARQLGHAPSQWRVVHFHDPVPHLPPRMLRLGYVHTPTEIFYNAQSSEYKVCDPTNGEDPTCSARIRGRPFKLVNRHHETYLNRTFAHTRLGSACIGSNAKKDRGLAVVVV